MMSEFFHPAALVPIAIVLLGLSQLIGAFLARPHFRRLNEIHDEVARSPERNGGDRIWVRSAMRDATAHWMMWFVALLAPILAFVLPIFAISDLLKRPTAEDVERELEELHRTRAKLYGGDADPATGHFWSSALRREANEHVVAIEWKQAPLLTAWISLWLMPGFLIALLISGAGEAVLRQYRLIGEVATQRLQSSLLHNP
jgi:hypothetical protein